VGAEVAVVVSEDPVKTLEAETATSDADSVKEAAMPEADWVRDAATPEADTATSLAEAVREAATPEAETATSEAEAVNEAAASLKDSVMSVICLLSPRPLSSMLEPMPA